MTLTDWIYIFCTFCLAITALVAPYLNDLWKRKSLEPKLKIVFHKEFPYILEPYETEDLYLLCFEVKNEGNSKAKNCEVIVEKFCYINEKEKFIEDNKNFPAKLSWINSDYLQIDILPKAGRFFRLFRTYISNNPDEKDIIFFEMSLQDELPYSPGVIREPLNHLKIKIVLYSENAKKCEQYIEIESPGIKREKKEDSLQELQIKLL